VTSNIIEAMVSVKRLADFLDASELQPDARTLIQSADPQQGDEVLSIKKGDFSWSSSAVEPTLEDINISVKKGELLGIFGRVGAGKVRGFGCSRKSVRLTRALADEFVVRYYW
jgi:ATP-binding cassette, subfamily C (CFTR/MRP), member 1